MRMYIFIYIYYIYIYILSGRKRRSNEFEEYDCVHASCKCGLCSAHRVGSQDQETTQRLLAECDIISGILLFVASIIIRFVTLHSPLAVAFKQLINIYIRPFLTVVVDSEVFVFHVGAFG